MKGGRFTLDDLSDANRRIALSQLARPDAGCALPHPEPEHHQAPALGGAAQGKETGMGRTRISFVGYRVRLLDPDNFAGSVKDLLDGLRHAGIISDDTPDKIVLETAQEKVGRYCDERTVITIERVP